MTTDDKIRDQKLQYDIKREAAKIIIIITKTVLSSGKIDKYEYFMGKEELLFNQS